MLFAELMGNEIIIICTITVHELCEGYLKTNLS